MATFELSGDMVNRTARAGHGERFERESRRLDANETEIVPEIKAEVGAFPERVRTESIIALKIYDSCRQQECLNGDELGPARSALDQTLNGKTYREGEIINPPDNAASVSIDCLRIKKIIIVDKHHNPFKRGYWDIDLKYVFEYCLEFREVNGKELGCLRASSIYTDKVTLFGSIGSDIVIATDLLSDMSDESPTLSLDPFVFVEAKPVPLSAKLKYARHRQGRREDGECAPNEVIVTIGLFSIVKLYRIVTLLVESRGFAIPGSCGEYSPVNVCEYFDRLPFPMDVFAPPLKPETSAELGEEITLEQLEEAAGC